MTVVTCTGIADDDWVSSMTRTGQTILGIATPRQAKAATSSSWRANARSPRPKTESDFSSRSKISPRNRRIDGAPWHDRHQVTNSKDNVRLPRQRRDYFDSLPSLRVSSGEYHEVPKHFAVSLDTFKGTSWKDQQTQLETRFALYPHKLEPLNEQPSSPSAEAASAAKKSHKGGTEDEPASQETEANAPAPVPMKMLLAALPDGGNRIAKRPIAHCNSMQSPGASELPHPRLRFEKAKTEDMPSTLQEQLMAASGSESDTKILQNFVNWCKKHYGSLSACWRAIDETGHMAISRTEFFKKMVDLRYPGDVKGLWGMLDRDHSNTISFLHFDPESAMMLAVFKRWATETYGCVEKLCEAVDMACRGKVTYKAFYLYCRAHGLEEEKPVKTIFKMCGNAGLQRMHSSSLARFGEEQTITLSSLTFLDRWECPEYLWISPDVEGLNHWRIKLMTKYKGNGIIAWRKELDKDESMRVNWLEFKTACKHLKEDVNVPGVWRALDNNLSGWLSLREFDPEGYGLLAKFKKYAQEKSGSCVRLVESMDSRGQTEISRNTFKAALKKAGIFSGEAQHQVQHQDQDDSQLQKSEAAQECLTDKNGAAMSERKLKHRFKSKDRRLSALEVEDEEIDHLFSGLDLDGSGFIRAHEVRFLDRWDVARELAEEAVWERLMKARWHALANGTTMNLDAGDRNFNRSSTSYHETSTTNRFQRAQTQPQMQHQ